MIACEFKYQLLIDVPTFCAFLFLHNSLNFPHNIFMYTNNIICVKFHIKWQAFGLVLNTPTCHIRGSVPVLASDSRFQVSQAFRDSSNGSGVEILPSMWENCWVLTLTLTVAYLHIIIDL